MNEKISYWKQTNKISDEAQKFRARALYMFAWASATVLILLGLARLAGNVPTLFEVKAAIAFGLGLIFSVLGFFFELNRPDGE